MAGQEESGPGRVTEALTELRRGSADAAQQLFEVVYSELHRLAAAQKPTRHFVSGHCESSSQHSGGVFSPVKHVFVAKSHKPGRHFVANPAH